MSRSEPDPTPERDPDGSGPSWGNVSERHWSRARLGANTEALEYYRQRSRAPGVEAGGSERNFYCMECDGVIPHAPAVSACPHCGAQVDPNVRRYFNWVEIDHPVKSDLRALLPILIAAVALLALVGVALWSWLS